MAELPTKPRRAAPADPRVPEALALCALALAVLWVYCPWDLLRGGVLSGADYDTLHVRRIEFARDHLLGKTGGPRLPAWYPREMLGTPFWSNLQNFPLLPTRLPLLLGDPWFAYGIGVNLAAVLAAAFSYLLCRRLGLGRLGSAVAGWTFACCGFFAARALAGHLPLLEAYPALPLLLWLVERYAGSASPREMRGNLLALGLTAGVVMLAGHPQLPVYAVGAAGLYLFVRAPLRRALPGAAAMAAGIGCGSFVLYPMALLIGRSTRVLDLAPARNDIWFPAWQLKALVLPWLDGWPPMVKHGGPYVPFTRADTAVFWDTHWYIGWLPVIAAAALAVRALATRRLPAAPWLFLAVIGVLALLTALPRPWSSDASESWTLLRSPARQVYVTLFALAVAAGAGVDAVARLRAQITRRGAKLAVAAALAVVVGAHALALRSHAVSFLLVSDEVPGAGDPGLSPALAQLIGDGRVGIETFLVHPLNRRIDDVGVFDSLLLARPYRALLALSGQPPETNVQSLSAPSLSRHALAWSGVRVVISGGRKLDLPVLDSGGGVAVYLVPDALPRAGFVPLSGVTYADEDMVLREMRGGAAPGADRVYLPPDARRTVATTTPTTRPAGAPLAQVTYRRPGADVIEVDVVAPEEGVVRLLETLDPGWSATVDGRPAELLLADAFVSAVRVGPGTHAIRLKYATPGAATGAVLSAAAAVALAALVWLAPRVAGLRAGGADPLPSPPP